MIEKNRLAPFMRKGEEQESMLEIDFLLENIEVVLCNNDKYSNSSFF